MYAWVESYTSHLRCTFMVINTHVGVKKRKGEEEASSDPFCSSLTNGNVCVSAKSWIKIQAVGKENRIYIYIAKYIRLVRFMDSKI